MESKDFQKYPYIIQNISRSPDSSILCVLKYKMLSEDDLAIFDKEEWNEGANGFTVKTRFQSSISINDIHKLIEANFIFVESRVIRSQLKILFAPDKLSTVFRRFN